MSSVETDTTNPNRLDALGSEVLMFLIDIPSTNWQSQQRKPRLDYYRYNFKYMTMRLMPYSPQGTQSVMHAVLD